MYSYLPEDMWIEALKEKMKHPECGAGCVFDNLFSKHLPNDEVQIINLLMRAIGNEAVTVLELDGIVSNKPAEENKSENKKSEGSEIMKETSKAQMNSIVELEK